MPICKSDILVLRKEETVFWLLKSTSHLHLVRIDSDMTDDKKEKLLHIYPCDSTKISKLGIQCSEIKKDKLQSVEADGYGKGDTLVLCVSGKKRRYTFDEDCDRNAVYRFFDGTEITETPQTDHNKKQPNPASRLAVTLNVVSIAVAAGCFLGLQPQKLWVWLCFGWQFVPIAVAVIFRADFRFAQYKRNRDNKGKIDLYIACAAPSLAMFVRINSDYTFLNSGTVLAIMGLSLAVAILLFALYVRLSGNGKSGFKSTAEVIITIAVIVFSAIMQVNCYLNPNPVDSFSAQVVDMDMSGVRHKTATCTVVMPDGKMQKLNLSKGKYYLHRHW